MRLILPKTQTEVDELYYSKVMRLHEQWREQAIRFHKAGNVARARSMERRARRWLAVAESINTPAAKAA